MTAQLDIMNSYIFAFIYQQNGVCVCVNKAQKVKKLVGLWKQCFLAINLGLLENLIISLSNGAPFVKIVGMSSRAEYVGCICRFFKIFSANGKLLFFCLLTLVWCCLVDWMIKVKQNKFLTIYYNYSLNNNHTQPQQCGICSSCCSPAWSYTAATWHPSLQLAFVASQPLWFCWSLWDKQHTQAYPTNVQWGWAPDSGQAIIFCLLQILGVALPLKRSHEV